MVYENRIVCFVDLLGFGALINSTNDNSHEAQRVKELFEKISITEIFYSILLNNFPEPRKLNEYVREKSAKDKKALLLFIESLIQLSDGLDQNVIQQLEKETKALHAFQVTRFSDSIVISCVRGSPQGNYDFLERFFTILSKIMIVCYEEFGLLMRGGVSVGKIHHNDSDVFGPAMLQCYELESKLAVYPRIIIDSSLEENYPHFKIIQKYTELIEQSDDGFHEINLSTAYKNNILMARQENSKALNDFYLAKRRAIEDEKKYRATKHHPKYSWVLNKFNGLESALPLTNEMIDFDKLYIKVPVDSH